MSKTYLTDKQIEEFKNKVFNQIDKNRINKLKELYKKTGIYFVDPSTDYRGNPNDILRFKKWVYTKYVFENSRHKNNLERINKKVEPNEYEMYLSRVFESEFKENDFKFLQNLHFQTRILSNIQNIIMDYVKTYKLDPITIKEVIFDKGIEKNYSIKNVDDKYLKETARVEKEIKKLDMESIPFNYYILIEYKVNLDSKIGNNYMTEYLQNRLKNDKINSNVYLNYLVKGRDTAYLHNHIN